MSVTARRGAEPGTIRRAQRGRRAARRLPCAWQARPHLSRRRRARAAGARGPSSCRGRRAPCGLHAVAAARVRAEPRARARRAGAERRRRRAPARAAEGARRQAAAGTLPTGWNVDRELVMVRRRSDRPPRPRERRGAAAAPGELARPRTRTALEPSHATRRCAASSSPRTRAGCGGARRQRVGIVRRPVVAWCSVFDDGTLTELDAVAVLPSSADAGSAGRSWKACWRGSRTAHGVPAGRRDDWPRRLYDRLGFDASASA